MMDYSDDLRDKIRQARSLTESRFPVLPFRSIKELINERRNSDRTWLIYLDAETRSREELSFREFCDHVISMACFIHKKGLKPGDRLAVVSHNHWHTAVQYYAAWFIGVVVVPVNVKESDDRIAYILGNSGVKLAFVREEYGEKIQRIQRREKANENIEICLCGKNNGPGHENSASEKLPDNIDGESDALIVYTSGTTGNPKGVLLSQNNLMEDARSIADWHGIGRQTRMMCVLPIHHVNGTVVTLLTPFFAGASVVLNRKFSARSFFRIINDEKVHIVSVVPTLLQFLNNEYKGKEAPESRTLSHIICGAGPLTINVARQFEETFKVRIVHGYGLSETTCYSCYLPVDLTDEEYKHWMRDYGYPAIGVPLPVNEMQIHDSAGNTLPERVPGEIVIRGLNVMKGYFRNHQANEQAFSNGWFRSGDEGFFIRDDKGRPFFFITGRLKELIIRGGINLSPLEIDEVISKAPGVESGIAVGFENDWYGEEVGAWVKIKPGEKTDEQAILSYCNAHLPFHKTPKAVVFGEDIPVTSTGKYQRLRVAGFFKQWKERQFQENKSKV